MQFGSDHFDATRCFKPIEARAFDDEYRMIVLVSCFLVRVSSSSAASSIRRATAAFVSFSDAFLNNTIVPAKKCVATRHSEEIGLFTKL